MLVTNKEVTMFKKVNGVEYILDKPTSDALYNDAVGLFKDHGTNIPIGDNVYLNTIKHAICYKVAMLVYTEIKEDLIKLKFISIRFSSDITFSVTVGWLDDKVVYGELIK